MADLSPLRVRNKELTNLEMEAMTLVNEDIMGPKVTDEQKYEELLDARKERKAGEKLYDFLERQVGDQMRTALGQPLQNISDNILNRVVSKNIQADLRKYKMGKKPERGTSALRNSSPGKRVRNYEDNGESFDQSNLADLSKEVSHYLSVLSTGSSNKMSLIKMQVIKCDENSNNYKRMRQCFNHGDIDEADRLLAMLEESNHQSLLDLQNEIQDGPSMVQAIGHLCEQLKKEKVEIGATTRGRSPGGYGRSRSTSNNRPGPAADYSKYDRQISELKCSLVSVEEENEKLRNTMREMVDDYTRQLELRDDTIRRIESNPPMQHNANQIPMLRQELDEYKQENIVLRGKINQLTRDVDMAHAGGSNQNALKNEIDQLNRQLMEKERFIDRNAADQKNEWAEIYGNQKSSQEKLERDNKMLSQDNVELKRQLSDNVKIPPNFGGGGASNPNEVAETTKRLKKRELECQALWDTLKDMKITGKQQMELSQMMQILQKRALDTKAHRKLAL